MLAISTDELTRLKNELDDIMTDSCTVSRKTNASDGAGGEVETWTTATSTYCRITKPTSLQEAILAGKISAKVDVLILLPATTGALVTDRIVVSSNTYEIVGIQNNTLNLAQYCYAKYLV